MSTHHELSELAKERRMGGYGTETAHREVRRIDLSDFAARKGEITDQLWEAAREIGFFQIFNHGIEADAVAEIFGLAERFFAMSDDVKAQYPLQRGFNSGWESMSQVRPSIATPDHKESYQITRTHMANLWPTEGEQPGFRATMLGFESQCWSVAMRVLSCFADKLGFDPEFFDRAHDPADPGYQSTLRLLHYYAIDGEAPAGGERWRAGAHTDFDCLTLLFQQEGQGGLQVCPGLEADAQEWTPIEPSGDTITCNIGDMLMRWSDDQLPSNFHRVKSPSPAEYQGDRYSMAFFAQANRDAMIRGAQGRHPEIRAADYLAQRVNANYAT